MKRFLRLAIPFVALVPFSQPVLAQDAPLDADALDAITVYCTADPENLFSSMRDCVYYVSHHYIPPDPGSNDGGSFLMQLHQGGGFEVYHIYPWEDLPPYDG